MGEIEDAYNRKIEDAKVNPDNHPQDKVWLEGFNAGLDWAQRIINKDKSAS